MNRTDIDTTQAIMESGDDAVSLIAFYHPLVESAKADGDDIVAHTVQGVNIRLKGGMQYSVEDNIHQITRSINEGIDPDELKRIKKIASSLKVGDKTTFGVVLKITKDGIQFKNRDTPKTFIKFNSRSGRDKLTLQKLIKVDEEGGMDSSAGVAGHDTPLGAPKTRKALEESLASPLSTLNTTGNSAYAIASRMLRGQ